MWETVELRELRVFLTLAEELHFRRTAERLHLTPSRVSQSLRELEHKLGVQLVHRTSRRVALTPAGERFRAEAGTAHAQLVRAFERTHAASRSLEGTLRIGLLTAAAAGPYLLDATRALKAHHPECRVEVSEMRVGDLFEPLRRGETDLMATYLPHGQADLVVGPILAREPRVLAVAVDHPLAGHTDVSIEDIADYRVAPMEEVFPDDIAEMLVPRRTPSGRPIPRLRVPLGEWAGLDRSRAGTQVAYLVAEGEIVHLTLPSMSTYWGHPRIVYIPIKDMPPVRSALVWRRGSKDARVQAFIPIARDVLRNATHREAAVKATAD